MLQLFTESELEPDVIGQLCRAEQKRGHLEAAIQYAYEGHAKFPDNAPLLKNLADLYFEKGDYAGAAALYDEAVELAPDDPQAWFKAGMAHFEAGGLKSSSRNMRELTRRFPSDPHAYDAYLRLADILYAQGDPKGAIDLLSSRLHEHVVAARRDPILSKIASIYLDLGLPELAAETYAKMLDGVDDDEVLAQMGVAHVKARRWDMGLTALRKVDRSSVPAELAYDMLVEMGIALRRFGSLTRALTNLETAVKEYPGERDERGVTALLRTYLAAKKLDDARKLISEIERWAAEDTARSALVAESRLIWADSLFSQGDYVSALKEFDGLARQEDLPESMREWAAYQMGNSYYELSRYGASVDAYQQFLADFPSSSWKKAAQTRLALAKAGTRLVEKGL
jgi:tetratricopeptide (TPR) repeat protein